MQKSTKEPRACLEEFLAAQEGVGGRLSSAGALIQVLTSSRSTEEAGRIQGSRVIEPAPETALAGNVRRNRALWAPSGPARCPHPPVSPRHLQMMSSVSASQAPSGKRWEKRHRQR